MDSNNEKKFKDIKAEELLKILSELKDKISNRTEITRKMLQLKGNNLNEIKELSDLIIEDLSLVKEIEYELSIRNNIYIVEYEDKEISISKLLKLNETYKNQKKYLNSLLYGLNEKTDQNSLKLYLEIQSKTFELIKKIKDIEKILSDFNLHN